MADASRDTLSAQNDLHVMQLAAIMTASIQNTRASISERIGRDNPYWTQAYGDVCVAIDREIAERERTASLEAVLLELVRVKDAENHHIALPYVERRAAWTAARNILGGERSADERHGSTHPLPGTDTYDILGGKSE